MRNRSVFWMILVALVLVLATSGPAAAQAVRDEYMPSSAATQPPTPQNTPLSPAENLLKGVVILAVSVAFIWRDKLPRAPNPTGAAAR